VRRNSADNAQNGYAVKCVPAKLNARGQYGVALSLHNTAKRGNLVLDEHLATVCLLREGKICAINSYLSDVEMVNAFFV
jgi:hypothetical protein